MTSLASIRDSLSAARLSRYLTACDGDIDRALRLYVWNAEVSAAFHIPLGQLEVVVRNAVHDALTGHARTSRWWEDDRLGIRPELAKQLRDVAAKAGRRLDGPVRGDDVVPAMSFGFWCRLLDRPYEDLWRRALRNSFPHLPAGAKRADLQRELDHLREFRNRVAHLERIFHRDLVADYDSILRGIAYVSPPTAVWVDDLSRVAEVLRQRPA